MIKRCVSLLFVFILLFSVGFVLAQDDSGVGEICGDFTYSSCPESCERACIPSSCDGDVCTSDCDGLGSCFESFGDDDFDEGEDDDGAVDLDEVEEEFDDSELDDVDAGLTPDSFFYFLDGISDSREEKVAEIREMIREGNIEAAREALEKYKEYVKEFEDDPDPANREEARRAAARINRMLRDLGREIMALEMMMES
tara:strand:- start:772 stop:1365 length:594 start_codon:yes stop_codon:yes gene_type:complete